MSARPSFPERWQVLNVEGFEKRVVYNLAKAYVNQLEAGAKYPALDDVIAVTICDFVLWPDTPREPSVPMLSRWRMHEQHGAGPRALGQLQLVFLELPKYSAGAAPRTPVEKWAYFFREAQDWAVAPEVLADRPYSDALAATRTAAMSEAEWDEYIRAGMAIQDERGALTLAHHHGVETGRLAQARAALMLVLEQRGFVLAGSDAERVAGCKDVSTLERWLRAALAAPTLAEALA